MSKRCPCCGSSVVRRSKRRGLERALSLAGVYPFRCDECHARFLSRGDDRSGSDPSVPTEESGVRRAASFRDVVAE